MVETEVGARTLPPFFGFRPSLKLDNRAILNLIPIPPAMLRHASHAPDWLIDGRMAIGVSYRKAVCRRLPYLSRPSLHAPSEAPVSVLSDAGVRLGTDYPRPIVEHGFARQRFLAIAESYLSKQK